MGSRDNHSAASSASLCCTRAPVAISDATFGEIPNEGKEISSTGVLTIC